MTKSNGITSLKQAAKLLNRHAPDGESLAFINPEEAKLLRAHGGSGIMTAAGVPSYVWDWLKPFIEPAKKLITKIAPKILPYGKQALDLLSMGKAHPSEIDQRPANLGDYGQSMDFMTPPYRPANLGDYGQSMDFMTPDKGNFLSDLARGAWTGIKERYSDPKNIVGDLGKAWLTVEAYKGQKDLNKFEQDKYDRALADIAAGEAEFASNIGAAPLEITNMPTPEKLAEFTETTGRPDMVTTAVAQGGRIGSFNGGIQGLMPQQAMPQQGMPQQGMPQQGFMPQQGLDPRMGYAAHGGRIGYTDAGDVDPEYNGWKKTYAVNKDAAALHPKNAEYLKRYEAEGNAQGGRIGYNLGGIDRPFQGIGALNRMGYAFGEEVEQVTEEVTPFAKIPENIKKADLDDIPNWWLTDFEQLIEDFKIDNNGQNPTSINQLEKWYRFKHATSQAGPTFSLDEYPENLFNNPPYKPTDQAVEDVMAAQGGRIGAQGGGIMPLLDMGGMEKDYRQEGGFVPIGRKEKADDVPARLSKNEFVFTADAVKAAGGGDIDEGAQRMYNVMKNLEAGGEISEQSQGQA